MDLKGPLSKSTYSTSLICAWKAYAHKVLRHPSIPNVYAKAGQDAHALWGQVLSDSVPFETAMQQAPNEEVAGLLKLAIMNEPIQCTHGHQFEIYTEATRDQIWLTKSNQGDVCGFSDREGVDPADGIWFVEDLKTGRYESDDPFERDLYVYLAHRRHGRDPIKFVRFFCRSGNAQVFTYTIEDIQRAEESVWTAVDQVKAMQPDPNPGEHCENWYGSPCQFLGGLCPAAADVPAVVGHQLPGPQANLGQAFLAVLNGEINHGSASLAYAAAQHLRGAVDQVMDRIKDFSRGNGPIQVGQDKFGWQNKISYVVDKPFVLETLLEAGVSTEDIAKAVSISKTSIMRLPRHLGQTKDALLKLAVNDEVTGETFGKIK